MKIRMTNGFRWGMSLFAFRDGKFTLVTHTGDYTWVGDEKVDEEVEAPAVGALIRWSDQGKKVTLIGFTPEELALAAPLDNCWFRHWSGQHTEESAVVRTKEDYLLAVLSGTLTPLKEGINELPFEWGCQRARHLVLVEGGVVVREVAGVGDRTPEDEDVLLPPETTRALRIERELRQSKWEAFKASYRGTRLYSAAKAAGFGDMIPCR
jgi:hypothetical protein